MKEFTKKEDNMKVIRQIKEKLEQNNRNKKIQKLGKWDDFRSRRIKVIDAYIKQRKI